MKWKTLYKCSCGEIIENGVGKWDNKFFLSELCTRCGTNKDEFKRIGVGYWKWTPTVFNWFKGEYIKKENLT